MTTIGFIGSGRIGGTVARLSVAAGHRVVLSNSRGPDTLKDLAGELGPLATAGTGERAAEAGDLVVVSTPVKAYPAVPPVAAGRSWHLASLARPAGTPASAAAIRAALDAARR